MDTANEEVYEDRHLQSIWQDQLVASGNIFIESPPMEAEFVVSSVPCNRLLARREFVARFVASYDSPASYKTGRQHGKARSQST